MQVLSKNSWATFKGLSRGHYWRDGIQEIHNFWVYGAYLNEFLIFLREIFFGGKILPISCDKHQKFDYGCSSHPGNEAQKSRFNRNEMKYSNWFNFFRREDGHCFPIQSKLKIPNLMFQDSDMNFRG